MTDFKPDCTINLHVELRGKPAKIVWCCSMEQARAGRVILARRFLGLVNREEAELQVLLFGMRQAARFLQEKVEIRASFSAEDHLLKERSGNRTPQELKPLRAEAVRLWEAFRFRRLGRLDGVQALALRQEGERGFLRKNKV